MLIKNLKKYMGLYFIIALFFYICMSRLDDIKLNCMKILDQNYTKEKADLLKALLLGDKTNMSDNIIDIFSKSNLSHILAISGLHVTYVSVYVEMALKKIIKNIKMRHIILILFLVFFMIFVGASPSALRAGIMMIMFYIAKLILREKDFYISFVVSFVIILIINPQNLFSLSMWLSYLGTLGIVLYSRLIQKVFSRKLKVKSKFLIKIIESISVSVSAQILIFPIIWKKFGSISLNFWISNLLVSELVAPILIIRLFIYNRFSNKRIYSLYRKHSFGNIFPNGLICFENTF